MQFEFSTLEHIRTNEIVEVFNSAFADYFVKINLDEKSLAEKMLIENTSLSGSVGAFFENRLVGFILHGIENGTAYNGGTGVLPEFRGNALTNKMYEYILPRLRSEAIQNQQLEVVVENTPAIKTYEKIGFQKVRTLACFKGKIAVTKINNEIEIKPLDKIDTTYFPQFWNSQPSWQNSISAIKRAQNLHKIVGAFYQNNLVGYVIFTETGRIKQFAVDKKMRHFGIGQTLFNQLNNKEIIITNIDESDAETCLFLQKTGLELFLRQFEMTMKVKNSLGKFLV